MKKIISIDLDGVLNNYTGKYDEKNIPGIKNGAKEFLEKLSKQYRIEIFTVRDIDLTNKWLNENNLSEYIENVSNIKNHFSSIFLDDRAINFDGNYNTAYQKIIEFKPYWKVTQ